MSLTSSQALSNFQFAPLDGTIQDRNLRPSAFDRTHKITITGTAEIPYGFSAGLTYVGQSGTPYTFVTNGDINGDGINGNDQVYVPASSTDILLADNATTMKTAAEENVALQAFIDSQDCLKEARGTILKRGACRNPWQNFLNVRLGWGIKTIDNQRVDVQLDIFNVLNLLNSDWGLFKQAGTGFETGTSFLQAVGYDAASNRPIYTFAAPASVINTVYSPTLSRWRIQVGARYTF
jgi:hypothetical protein